MREGMIRTLLYGLLIWLVPFIIASVLWDPAINEPRIAFDWFTAILTLSWAVVYSFVVFGYFKQLSGMSPGYGWKIGVIWYLEVIVLEFIFIVLVFGNSFADFAPLLLTDTPTLIVTGMLGYLIGKKRPRV